MTAKFGTALLGAIVHWGLLFMSLFEDKLYDK